MTVWFPYFLVCLLATCIASLWFAVSAERTQFVQAFYVFTMLTAFSIFVSGLWSSLRYAFTPSKEYWRSGYPFMLATAFLSYGIFKSLPQWNVVGFLVVGFVVGGFLGLRIPERLRRLLPLTTIIGFVILGDYGEWRELRSFGLGSCSGIFFALYLRREGPKPSS